VALVAANCVGIATNIEQVFDHHAEYPEVGPFQLRYAYRLQLMHRSVACNTVTRCGNCAPLLLSSKSKERIA
jgi:hypothetical protein